MSPKHAILGWGSLLWDEAGFRLELRAGWQGGAPQIPIEFSRVSGSRHGALTLVIDPNHGALCPTSYAVSSRSHLDDVIADLRCREGTVVRRIGFVDLVTGAQRSNVLPHLADQLRVWGGVHGFASVVWTDLPSNFDEDGRGPYSVPAAVAYLRDDLSPLGQRKAKEYIARAPPAVVTQLRTKLRDTTWWRGYGAT